MGLLSTFWNGIFPKNKPKPKNRRPFVNFSPSFLNSDLEFVGNTAANAIHAISSAPMDNIVQRVGKAIGGIGGISFNLGGDGAKYQYKVDLNVGTVTEIISDPNGAVDKLVDGVEAKRKAANGFFSNLFMNMVSGYHDTESQFMIRGMPTGGGVFDDGFKRTMQKAYNPELADSYLLNPEVLSWGLDQVGYNAALEYAGKHNLVVNGRIDWGRASVDQRRDMESMRRYFRSLDRKRIRDVNSRIRSAHGGTEVRKRDFASVVSTDLAGGGYVASSEAQEIIAKHLREDVVDLNSKLGTKGHAGIYGLARKNAVDRLIYGEEDPGGIITRAPTAEERKLGLRLINSEGRKSKISNIYGHYQNIKGTLGLDFLGEGAPFTALFMGLLNGDFFRSFALDPNNSATALRVYTMGKSKFSSLMGILYLLHPGSITRAWWDGDWFRVYNALAEKHGWPKINKLFSVFRTDGLKYLISDWFGNKIGQAGIRYAEELARKVGAHALADLIKQSYNVGFDTAVKKTVSVAIKAAFNKLAEAAISKLTAAGLASIAGAIGTVLTGVGGIVAFVVSWVVAEVASKIMLKLLKILVKAIVLVAYLIVVSIILTMSIIQELQMLMTTHMLPGQTFGDLTGGAYTSILDEVPGGDPNNPNDDTSMYPIDFNATLAELSLSYSTGGIFGSQYCTQGYFGNMNDSVCTWSHCNLYKNNNTYALDITGGSTVRSPVKGVVREIRASSYSLDWIIVQEEETGSMFQFQHIDSSKCYVSVGESVNVGDNLCDIFYAYRPLNSGECISCSKCGGVIYDINNNTQGCSCCWTGPHVHTFARTPSGNPIDIAPLYGVNEKSCPRGG